MNPTLACIGGTAAYDLLQNGTLEAKRLGTYATPFGESQPIYLCKAGDSAFYFLSRHGESRYELASSFINSRANIFALKDLGVRAIICWSETRAVNHNYRIGEYVVVSDLIDETFRRENTFFENRGIGVVRQWPVFCPSLRSVFETSLSAESCAHHNQGVYVCIEGPRRETPAEAHKYQMLGGDLLGSTLVPEVFLAKELEMCYASLCYVAGYGETGHEFRPFEDGVVLDDETRQARARRAIDRLPRILERLCVAAAGSRFECQCNQTMRKHIERGEIGEDWRTWFRMGTNGPVKSAAARRGDVVLPPESATHAPAAARPQARA